MLKITIVGGQIIDDSGFIDIIDSLEERPNLKELKIGF